MSIVVRIEGVEELQAKLDQLRGDMAEAEYALTGAVDEIIVPRAEARSMAVWNVRTGRYSSSLYSQKLPGGVAVGFDAPYAAPLEHGWTTRKGTHISSPGVLYTVVRESFEDLVGAVNEWMRRIVEKPS